MEFTKDIKFNSNPIANQYITLTYNGFLKDSSELTIVYGFGEAWENTTESKMEKTSDGFVAKLKILNSDTFNFCFRNSNNVWDNNFNCNYVSSISPYNVEKIELLFDELLTPQKEEIQEFDIDALIEELLQPIVAKSEIEEPATLEINTQPIDLGVEISRILSEINYENTTQELAEYSDLDELLSGIVIEETPVELFAEPSVDDIVNELIENTTGKSNILNDVSSVKYETTNSISQEEFEYYSEINDKVTNITNKIDEQQNALIATEDSFCISPRQLSKFYLWRKRIKLAFYKALVKIPKLIFGLDQN